MRMTSLTHSNNMANKIRLGVLFGGRSVENEISVVTALQVISSLDENKYEIVPIYIAKTGKWYSGKALLEVSNYKDFKSLFAMCDEVYVRSIYGDYNLYKAKKSLFSNEVLATLDVILPTLHGTNCEDGTIQGVLDTIGIPYVGCNTLASANGMDKITMKMILRESNIPTIDYVWFSDKQWDMEKDSVIAKIESHLGYPVIVKPANSGSSIGISPAHNREELETAVADACRFTSRVIIEHLVEQLKEVNCSVMGNYYECSPSVCEVPVRSGEILSYQDKYMGGDGKTGTKSKGMRSTRREILPKDETTQKIQTLAVETFRALACEGVSRIDFIVDEKDNNIYVNEINTIPGSLSSYLWEFTGKAFKDTLDELIQLAFARKRDQGFKTVDFGGNIFSSMKKGGKIGGSKGGKF